MSSPVSDTPQHSPGDVVNGHVLTAEGQWVPTGSGGAAAPAAPTPQQPKAKKPLWKRWWVIALVVLLLIIIFANLGGGGDAAETDATPQTAAEEPAGAAEEPVDEEPPAEEPAVNPYEEQYGTFEPVELSGTGDSVIPVPMGGTVGVVTATHSGSANFAIAGLDANNQSTGDLLVNTIGAYSGTTAYGLSSMGEAVNLKVTADGAWSVTITPASAAPVLESPATGAGDAVFLYDGGAESWALTHSGSSNFTVIQYGAMFPNLMVNEIGTYEGTVPVEAGPAVVTVGADGDWTITAQ